MANFELHGGIPRREALRLAAMTTLAFWIESSAVAADFWVKKKPSEWTDQEKQELQTKSPWAKKVDADVASGGGGGSRGGGGGGSEGAGGGGGGSRGGGGGGGGSRGGGGGGGGSAAPSGGGSASIPLAVVWESAKPIQDAHPVTLPAKLDGHYIIGVSGIPQNVLNAAMMGRGGGRGGSGRQIGGGRAGGGGSRDAGGFAGGQAAGGPPPGTADVDTVNAGPPAPPPDPSAGLKRGATITVKGKAPQNADLVMQMNNNQTVLFAFTKDALSLAAADKEVEFDLKLGNMSAKVKFTLKDMMYQEELAL